jgi:DNA-binding transcriptional LysR family regulator
MELRHLRYFVAVGEEQHYRRASRRLRLAQPALSRQIQDLEEEVGFKLFDRLPRGVKLSAAGRLFLEDARRILQAVNEATARAARGRNPEQRHARTHFRESRRAASLTDREPRGDSGSGNPTRNCNFNLRRPRLESMKFSVFSDRR